MSGFESEGGRRAPTGWYFIFRLLYLAKTVDVLTRDGRMNSVIRIQKEGPMHRRTLLKGGVTLLASTLAVPQDAGARLGPVLPEDEKFMKVALQEAAEAAFPFGAVIVKKGEVMARGHNRTGVDHDPTAHGEMVALRAFLAAHGPEDLKGSTLYTSGEPCCMCMGAIIWCGLGRLVFAASVMQIASKLDQIAISAEDVAEKSPFASIDITGGVLADDAMRLFK